MSVTRHSRGLGSAADRKTEKSFSLGQWKRLHMTCWPSAAASFRRLLHQRVGWSMRGSQKTVSARGRHELSAMLEEDEADDEEEEEASPPPSAIR